MEERKSKIPDYKTILAGSGVALALYTVAPFKEFFFTREEGTGIQRQVEENKREIGAIKNQISDFRNEVTKKFGTLKDEIEDELEEGQKDLKSDFRGEISRAVQAITDQNKFHYEQVIERIERDYQNLSDRIHRNERGKDGNQRD